MAGPKDSALDVRTAADGDLDGDETVSVTIAGGVHTKRPLSLKVVCPEAPAASDTLQVTVKSVTTDKKVEVTHTDLFTSSLTYPQELSLPLPPVNAESWQVVFNTTDGGGGGFDMGAVLAWLELEDAQAIVPATP